MTYAPTSVVTKKNHIHEHYLPIVYPLVMTNVAMENGHLYTIVSFRIRYGQF